jgi:hypothetical protein
MLRTVVLREEGGHLWRFLGISIQGQAACSYRLSLEVWPA